MSVLYDIMKKSNPLSSQGVATQAAAVQPNTASQPSTAVQPSTAAAVQPNTATQTAVNNGAAVTQMPKTGFNAEIAKVGHNVLNNMNQQPVQPNTAVPTPAPTPAAQPQQMSYVDMLNKMYTPETPEEKAKRERKEKWDKTSAAIGDGISALANLYFTTQGSPNSYDGKNSMSERTRQLYEKLDKDRKENDRWYLNYYMNAAKMDEEAKRYKDQIDYRDKQDAIKKEQYEEGIAHRNAREAVQDANTKWQQEFQKSNADWQHANTEKQQAEQKRQFWANHNMQVQNIKRQLEKENPTIDMVLGDGKSAKIKKQALNAHNVSYVYNKLPQEVKDKYATEPVYDKNTGFPMPNITKPRKLTQDDMMAIIGEHIANYPDVQNAWKEVGGEITTSTQQSGGGKKHSHRVGGNNSGTTDV